MPTSHKLNILLIYPKHPWATAYYLEKALRKKHHVETFDLFQTREYFHLATRKRSLAFGKFTFNIPALSFTRKRKTTNILSIIKEKCKNRPDVIIEIDGIGLLHLEGYKNIDIPTVYYAIDSHVKLEFQKYIASDFDYVFVAQKDYLEDFRKVTKNVFWLPLAANPEIWSYAQVPKYFDIGFVGSTDPRRGGQIYKRAELLTMLRQRYSVIAATCNPKDAAKVYNLCKIGFNRSMKGDLNMRVFEVMSCGTMLLTDRISNGLLDLFEDRKHLVTYKNEEELDELVRYYLENDDERERIALKGREEVHAKHTYDKRVEYMLRIMTEGREG